MMLDFIHDDLREPHGSDEYRIALLSAFGETHSPSPRVGRFQPITDLIDRCVVKAHRLEGRVQATA